jgi:hypothetical protein
VDDGVEGVGHPVDQLGEAHFADRFPHFVVGRFRTGEGDVETETAGEEEWFLGDHPELTTQ